MSEVENVQDGPGFKKFLLGVVIVIILFFAGLYYIKYVIPETPVHPTITYNGFIFENIGNVWFTDWQRGEQLYNLAFRYSPTEAETVPLEGWIDESFNQPDIYISFNLTSEFGDENTYMALAATELTLSAVRAMNRTAYSACMQNITETCHTEPIITCDNTDLAVVEVVPAEPTMIRMNKNCIRIQGKDLELVRAVDKVLYLWYRIIQP